MSTSTGTSGSSNIQLNTLSNWVEVDTGDPLGTHGGYVIAVDYGTSKEEKIYVPQGAVGSSLTGVTRGYDSTQISTHTDLTAQVVVVFSATEFKESNNAVGAVANLLKGTASANPAPADITRSITGLQGTSVVAAAANHTHTLPDSIVKAIIDSSYITNSLDAVTYVQNIVTAAYVQGYVTSSFVTGLLDTASYVPKIPAARLYGSANQNLTAGVGTNVTLGTTQYSKNGTTVASNAITVPVAGVYRVSGYAHFSTVPTGNWYLRPILNGSTSNPFVGLQSQIGNPPNGVGTNVMQFTFEYLLSANDSIGLYALTSNATIIDVASLSVSLVTN